MARQTMAAAVAVLLALAAGAAAQPRQMPGRGASNCGGIGQKCCPECPPDTPLTACDQWSCTNNAQCYMFAGEQGLPPDGGEGFPMVCLSTPKTCGQEGQPCCYNSDPASACWERGNCSLGAVGTAAGSDRVCCARVMLFNNALAQPQRTPPSIPAGEDRCKGGLTCIAENVIPYSSYDQYQKLLSDASRTSDASLMGTCKKLTKSDCGKMWRPCGAAASKLGCSGDALKCGAGSFCGSPGDTRLGAPRCLPLPESCGKVGKACCPANKDGIVRERSFIDKKTPVPFCEDGQSMCVWAHEDFANYGTKQFPESPGACVYACVHVCMLWVCVRLKRGVVDDLQVQQSVLRVLSVLRCNRLMLVLSLSSHPKQKPAHAHPSNRHQTL